MVVLCKYLILFVSEKAYALDVGVKLPFSKGTSYASACEYTKDLYTFALNAGFVLAGLMLIYSGYRYLTSQGNSTQINDAKDIMIGSIIGFIILLLAQAIMNILGVDSKCK